MLGKRDSKPILLIFLALLGLLPLIMVSNSPLFAQNNSDIFRKKNLVGLFRPNTGPLSPKTKIFLVAGSSQNANFDQEIIDQRRLWKSIGFGDDEIACYYIVPNQQEYKRDNDQYIDLSLWLSDCYPTSVQLLRNHLHKISQLNPPFIYLYVTSHGKKPVTLELKDADPSSRRYEQLKQMAQYPVLDQYRLLIDALPEGPANQTEIFAEYKKGKNPRDLYLTPAYLREILLEFNPEIPKYIVLQGCYSGGFINDYQVNFKDRLLSNVPDITILTAARYDRTSFGCNAGPKTTYYGGAFSQALSNYIDIPTRMDWRALYKEVLDKVQILEEDVERYPPSLPAFFSNQEEIASPH